MWVVGHVVVSVKNSKKCKEINFIFSVNITIIVHASASIFLTKREAELGPCKLYRLHG